MERLVCFCEFVPYMSVKSGVRNGAHTNFFPETTGGHPRRSGVTLIYTASLSQFWLATSKLQKSDWCSSLDIILSACDRLPEEICCSQQILARDCSSRACMKFEHQISEGSLSHLRPGDCFYSTTLNFERNCQKRALCADKHHWGETLPRHVIDFNQWEHAKI